MWASVTIWNTSSCLFLEQQSSCCLFIYFSLGGTHFIKASCQLLGVVTVCFFFLQGYPESFQKCTILSSSPSPLFFLSWKDLPETIHLFYSCCIWRSPVCNHCEESQWSHSLLGMWNLSVHNTENECNWIARQQLWRSLRPCFLMSSLGLWLLSVLVHRALWFGEQRSSPKGNKMHKN